MRVITGSAKGHRLKAPKGLNTRPMLDRVKESLFGVLDARNALHGNVLDLYAGTGSLGIECLSRGASLAHFVERSAHVCRIIRENLEHTRLAAQATVYCMPVTHFVRSYGSVTNYDIIIMDPPYADPHIEQTILSIEAAHMVQGQTLLVVGHSPRVSLADTYNRLNRCLWRRVGDSCFSLYEHKQGPPADP
ncbi:MAG: 16S rRNA (guanine(966)-N(2))-methyltransferase RsmD [Chloroflexaceae bacterium]|nr:16S rRNA (guanine(966)-N(2))-methyltransferase RsmD [Chloroflexaceae bacterium]